MTSEAVDIFKYKEIAKERSDQGNYDFIAGAATDEVTLRRTRSVFDCVMMRPRMMVDVSDRDLSTTVLGHKISFQVMLYPDAELASVRAAGGRGSGRWTYRGLPGRG